MKVGSIDIRSLIRRWITNKMDFFKMDFRQMFMILGTQHFQVKEGGDRRLKHSLFRIKMDFRQMFVK